LAVSYAVLAAGTVALIFLRPVADRLADLHVYWGAAQWVLHGRPLYAFAAGNGDPFTYPPFALVIFLPLGLLPEPVVGAVWTVGTLVALVLIARLVVTRWENVHADNQQALVWACAIGLLLSAPGQSNVRFGQVSVFVVLAALADAVGAVPARWRGVLVGVAAAVKLTPLLFVVYYLLAGRRKDAARAAAAFVGCGLLSGLAMPGASWTYWTSAMASTSRIGDLAALGNQSVNGILLRAGIPGRWRPLVWAVVLLALVTAALWRARTLHRAGLATHAAVLVGCATVAASPVSWTHHQFWTVLAAMLLVAGPPGLRRAAGWLLLASMTVNLADIVARLPIGDHALFVAANMRGLAAATVCVAGFGHLARSTLADPARQPSRPDPRLPPAWSRPAWSRPAWSRPAWSRPAWSRPAWSRPAPSRSVLAAAAAAAALFAVMPLPIGADPDLRAASPARARHLVYDEVNWCRTPTPADNCGQIPLFPGLPVNYSVGTTPTGGADVQGFAAASVARLTYLPAPGTDAVQIPLGTLPTGDHVFAFTTGDAAYAQLKAYDHDGHLIGEMGGKIRAEAG
jgi:alpha-1,2-mannosyltransferase